MSFRHPLRAARLAALGLIAPLAILAAPHEARAQNANYSNYIQANGAATGNSPVMGAYGSDTNVNLTFTPQGTGNVIVSSGNVGIGTTTPASPLSVMKNGGTVGTNLIKADSNDTWGNGLTINNTSAGGHNWELFSFGSASGLTGKFQVYDITASATRMIIDTSGNVGIGTTTPVQALEVNGQVKVDTFAAASATTVCQNANVLSTCSSSIRYKENVKDGGFGLKELLRMRPVTFKWKGRDENDFGFIAEEMEKIDPLFVSYARGQIEGVKYPQLSAVIVNAVKEQQTQINQQQAEIESLKAANDNLDARLKTLEHQRR